MIELFQIFIFFIIFLIILFVPFNIFHEKSYIQDLSVIERSSLNLAINLNILLFISFLNYPLQTFQPIILIIYSLIFFFNYKKRSVLLKDFLFFLLPLFIIFFILSISISSNLYLGWDAKYFYYIKSLFFFEGKTIFDLNNFSENFWHPHFGSYLWGFFRTISLTETEYFGRLFYLFLFCYSFFLVSQSEKDQKINISIFLVLIIIFYEYKFFSGLQEILIFSLLVLISKFFYEFLNKQDHIYAILIILFSNLFIWIKSEGIIYFLLPFLMILYMGKNSFKPKLYIPLTLLLLYIIKIIVYEISSLNINSQIAFYNFDYFKSLDVDIVIGKIGHITVWLMYYILTNIFYPLFLFLIIINRLYIKKDEINYKYFKLIYIYLFYISIFIYSAYIFRDMEIVQSIRTTMDRIVMTASGFLVYPCIKITMSYLRYKNIVK
jgi:hypothetical protein